jgi:hypothetical protein
VTSSNNTVVVTGTSAAITDASGNSWTISSTGTVLMNGAAAGYSAGVAEIAYVDGGVWQENTAGLWWEWSNGTWGTGPGTATSPLPASSSPTPTPTPAPTPTPTSTPPEITIGAPQTVDASTVGTFTEDGASINIGAPGVASLVLGPAPTSLTFTNMIAIAVQGGAGAATITADGGTNIFDVGAGDMTITGGTGADAYTVAAGSGALTVEDFSPAKGDTLTIDSSLLPSMQYTSDGQGGTLIAFSGLAGSVDLKGDPVMPKVATS